MGASGWKYFVPYDADFGAALTRLHRDVFERGEYYRRSTLRKPKTIEALRKSNAEDGTHSILDITHVAPKPATPGRENLWSPPSNPAEHPQWVAQLQKTMGSARELHDDDLVALFGTTKPTRAAIEGNEHEIQELRSRGLGTIVVIYKDERPHELLFIGYSGD